MPRTSSIAPRPYRNSQKPHLKWLVPVPAECQKAEGRKKAFFAVRVEAASFAERMRRDQERGRSLAFQLTESQRFEAAECIAALLPRGKTLREAIQFYLEHLDSAERSAKVSILIKEFLAAKTAAGLSRAYLAPLSSRLRAFEKDFGEQFASALTAATLEEWLTSKAADLVTRNNIRRNIGTLFSFAVTRRYISTNPVKHVTKAKEPPKNIEALTVNELRALLHTCDGVLLPLVAIGAFAGIRPEEITKLQWSNVDFDNGEIDVPAQVSKTGTRRIVVIEPILAAWLAPHMGKTGLIIPIDPRARFEAARARLATNGTLTRWPNDVLRHSFASYHLARWQNAPALALQMGHIDNRVIFSNYRKVVTTRDAAIYWNLYPDGPIPI